MGGDRRKGRFESSVIPSGSKTCGLSRRGGHAFESSVIPSGSKTLCIGRPLREAFESSVIPSGSKTTGAFCAPAV